MESSSNTTPTSFSAAVVAKRTQQCLAEMRVQYRQTKLPANLVLILGRLGAGKSSFLEDLTGSKGHSQQTIDSVTREFEIEKACIDNEEFFIMDTPGFDPGSEWQTFLEITRGIQATRTFARVAGILYLTCINQPRFDGMDRKLVNFTRALCGDEFLPYLTFVTTFWTAADERQRDAFNNQLKYLQLQWQEEHTGQQHQQYLHGREYIAGKGPGRFLDWFGSREQVAQHARDMITRHYGGHRGQANTILAPKLVEELDADIPIDNTKAGKVLAPAPAPTGASDTTRPRGSSGHRRAEPTQQGAASSDSPKPAFGGDGKPAAAQARRTEDFQGQPESSKSLVSQGFSFVLEAGKLLVNHWDSISSLFGALRTGGPTFTMGNKYNGPLDRNSVVDVMKSHGLDSSREGRKKYADAHGIGGVPFSADWNESIRRHVLRRYGR